MKKAKDLRALIRGLTTTPQGLLGGFGTLRGGKAYYPAANDSCNNESCSNSNSPGCTNTFNCTLSSNKDCTNSGSCFA